MRGFFFAPDGISGAFKNFGVVAFKHDGRRAQSKFTQTGSFKFNGKDHQRQDAFLPTGDSLAVLIGSKL